MSTDERRCPLDGAPLREWTEAVNEPPKYVHVDGTTHGGLLEVAETFNATMAKLEESLAPLVAELNASLQRFTIAAKAIEWPRFPSRDGGAES
jgi:hypothetical protein